MKFITTLLASATLAFAAGCATTTNDQASLSAVSGTSACCSASLKAVGTACCASKAANAKSITCPLTGKQINPADCPAAKAAADKPALSAVNGKASSCCASKAAAAKAAADKPSLGAVEATKAKSGCCSSQKAAGGCPFSKKSE